MTFNPFSQLPYEIRATIFLKATTPEESANQTAFKTLALTDKLFNNTVNNIRNTIIKNFIKNFIPTVLSKIIFNDEEFIESFEAAFKNTVNKNKLATILFSRNLPDSLVHRSYYIEEMAYSLVQTITKDLKIEDQDARYQLIEILVPYAIAKFCLHNFLVPHSSYYGQWSFLHYYAAILNPSFEPALKALTSYYQCIQTEKLYDRKHLTPLDVAIARGNNKAIEFFLSDQGIRLTDINPAKPSGMKRALSALICSDTQSLRAPLSTYVNRRSATLLLEKIMKLNQWEVLTNLPEDMMNELKAWLKLDSITPETISDYLKKINAIEVSQNEVSSLINTVSNTKDDFYSRASEFYQLFYKSKSKEHYEKALNTLQIAIPFYEGKANEKERFIGCRYILALLFFMNQEFDKAIPYFEYVYSDWIKKRVHDSNKIDYLRYYLALCYKQTKQLHSATVVLRQIKIKNKVENTLLKKVLLELADIYHRINEIDIALDYLSDLQELLISENNPKNISNYLALAERFFKAGIHSDGEGFKEAISCYKAVLIFDAQNVQAMFGLSKTYLEYARTEISEYENFSSGQDEDDFLESVIKKLNKSMKYVTHSSEVSQKINRLRSEIHLQLALFHKTYNDDYHLIISLFKKTLLYIDYLPISITRQCYLSLANFSNKTENYRDALGYLEIASDFYQNFKNVTIDDKEHLGELRRLAETEQQYGFSLWKIKHHDEAIEHLLKAEEYYLRLNDSSNIANTRLGLSLCQYFGNKNYQEANRLLQASLSFIFQNKNADIYRSIAMTIQLWLGDFNEFRSKLSVPCAATNAFVVIIRYCEDFYTTQKRSHEEANTYDKRKIDEEEEKNDTVNSAKRFKADFYSSGFQPPNL